jgi:signal transduction histidine kinase
VSEIAFGAYLFYRYGGFLSLFLFSAIFDALSSNTRRRQVYWGTAFLLLFFLFYHLPVLLNATGIQQQELGDLSLLVISMLLISSLHEERKRKITAQELYDQLRTSEDKLREAVSALEQYSSTIEELTLLRERTRISRELHDSVGHALSTLSLQLQAIHALMDKDPVQAKSMLSGISQFTKNALENVRRAVRELRPIEFDAYEGIFAIEELVRNFTKLTGIHTRLILSQNRYPMNSEQSHQLYQIIKESLSNSIRHGKANKITISIQFLEDAIYSQIKDDGAGCDSIHFGMGLKGMQERTMALGGEMHAYSKPEKGFEVVVTLPKKTTLPVQKEDSDDSRSRC